MTESEYIPIERAENVGVVAADVYFPSTYVAQEELEKCDGVAPGKYTKGLGQDAMAVCDSREDINSICLTVVHSIMEKYDIPWDQIGRLEVGTETLVDKSKSVKSTIMQLFEARGCNEIEGVDTINACYGGTSALFNALAWCESSAWDGRYALVVAADIAVYDRGAARPTGGVGAVAMLVGPDAALVIEPGLRGTHMEHAFDFYKPQMVSEYPTVDGHLSNACYIRALDRCYNRYADRFQTRLGRQFSLENDVDYAIFHQPYAKLVQKSWARLAWNDYLLESGSGDDASSQATVDTGEMSDYLHIAGTDESMSDRGLEKAAVKASNQSYTDKVTPSMVLGKEVGNSYCGSLYNGMASLIDAKADAADGSGIDTDGSDGDGSFKDKRVLMFSYGSGLAASMFSVKVRKPVGHIKRAMDIQQRLSTRVALDPDDYHNTVDQREKDYTKYDYTPQTSTEHYFPGTYYLDKVDELHRRSYSRKPAVGANGTMKNGNGNVDLYVKSQGNQLQGGRGMFTTTRRAGLGGTYHYRGAPVTHINSAISDPFNMLLGEKQMTAQARSGASKAMANSSSGYSTAKTTTSMAIADPFNMDLDETSNVYVMHHIESARDAARVAHTNCIRADHQAALSRCVMKNGGGGAVRGMHTVARGAMRAMRFLK